MTCDVSKIVVAFTAPGRMLVSVPSDSDPKLPIANDWFGAVNHAVPGPNCLTSTTLNRPVKIIVAGHQTGFSPLLFACLKADIHGNVSECGVT